MMYGYKITIFNNTDDNYYWLNPPKLSDLSSFRASFSSIHYGLYIIDILFSLFRPGICTTAIWVNFQVYHNNY